MNTLCTFAATNTLHAITGKSFSVETVAERCFGFTGPDDFKLMILASPGGERFGVVVSRNGLNLFETSCRFSFDGAVLKAAEYLAEKMEKVAVAEMRGGFRLLPSGGLYCPHCASFCDEPGERFEGEGICCNCGLDTYGNQVDGRAGHLVWIAADNVAAMREAELATDIAVQAAESLEAVMVLKDKLAAETRRADAAERELARLRGILANALGEV